MYGAVLLKFTLASVLSAYVSVVTYVHLSRELRNWAVGDFYIRNFGFWAVISHFTESFEIHPEQKNNFHNESPSLRASVLPHLFLWIVLLLK